MPPVWLFDLDNTLHDASEWVFPEMNRLMTIYMATHLELNHWEADRLRHRYWHRYGATLGGLRRHHAHIDPEHFLAFTHPDPVASMRLKAIAGAREVLPALPGRKILFTNAQAAYARTVLQGLDLLRYFEAVVSIGDIAYRPKPHAYGYHWLLRRFKVSARHCIMVEDSRDNLLTAKRLGMQTIWLSRSHNRHPMVDHTIHDLHALLRLPLNQSAASAGD